MQIGTTLPRRSNLAYIGAAVFAFLLLGGLLITQADLGASKTAAPVSAAFSGQVAYFQFASDADTLWVAEASNPSQRKQVVVLPHANDFGVIPSLAPDGKRFVYTSLAPEIKAPSADTPAGLWLASLDGDEPRMLTDAVDLLVPAVWSPDASLVVVRRTIAATASHPEIYQLLRVDTAKGVETVIAQSDTTTLFPITFTPDGRSLYVATLDVSGTQLQALDIASGVQRPVARLSDGLSRDWTLSPTGDRLAYLQVVYTPDRLASRAFVLDIASGRIDQAGDESADAFKPVWTSDGSLFIGQLQAGKPGSLVRVGGNVVGAPKRGFDVPLTAGRGGFAVESFNGASLKAPGTSVIALVSPSGEHLTIASGEVTFLGWINP